jgi:hypothetical protein
VPDFEILTKSSGTKSQLDAGTARGSSTCAGIAGLDEDLRSNASCSRVHPGPIQYILPTGASAHGCARGQPQQARVLNYRINKPHRNQEDTTKALSCSIRRSRIQGRPEPRAGHGKFSMVRHQLPRLPVSLPEAAMLMVPKACQSLLPSLLFHGIRSLELEDGVWYDMNLPIDQC